MVYVRLIQAAMVGGHKNIVESYYQTVWIDQQSDALAEFVHAQLIQHSPEIDNGVEGFRLM